MTKPRKTALEENIVIGDQSPFSQQAAVSGPQTPAGLPMAPQGMKRNGGGAGMAHPGYLYLVPLGPGF